MIKLFKKSKPKTTRIGDMSNIPTGGIIFEAQRKIGPAVSLIKRVKGFNGTPGNQDKSTFRIISNCKTLKNICTTTIKYSMRKT